MKKLAAVCTLLIVALGTVAARADGPPMLAVQRPHLLGSYIFQPLPSGLLTWSATDPAPGLTQATQTSDAAPPNMVITPGAPLASASTNKTAGSLILNEPTPVAGGNEAPFVIQRGGVAQFWFQGLNTSPTAGGALYMNVAPGTNNYTLFGASTSTELNVPSSGELYFNVANVAVATMTGSLVTLVQPTSLSSTLAVTGNATLSAGQTVKQVTKTGNYTVDGTPSDFIVFTDSTSNTVQITCPAPAAGRCFYVKDKTGKVTTHAVTVTHNAAETIDGAATITMTKNFDSVYLCSDGTNWAVMSEYSTTIVP